LNCVETKSDEEAYEFKEDFLTGVFAEEAKLSIEECVNYYG
jgi:hypothetical protein